MSEWSFLGRGGAVERFLERLQAEATFWVSEGIITEEARQKILARYGGEYLERVTVSRQGRLTQIIVTLGAILIGAGVLLFISANWDTMPKGFKLLIIFSSIAIAYGAGLWLESIKFERTALGLIFLGSILYGAGIALIAQIYNIEAGNGTIFLLWGGGVLLTGLALASELLFSFSAILFICWTIFTRFGNVFSFFFGFGRDKSLLHWEYFIPAAILFCVAYYWKKDKLIAFNLLGVILWLALSLSAWNIGIGTALVFFLVFGAFLLLLAFFQIYLGVERLMTLPYSFFGITGIIVASYAFSFNATLNQYRYDELSKVDTFYWILLIFFAAMTILGSIVIFLAPNINNIFRFGFLGIMLLVAFAFVFLLFPVTPALPQGGYYYSYSNALNPYTILWNIVSALEILGLISLGYVTNERIYVNIGILFFGILVMSRYFDVFSLYFGTYGSFMIGGALFIALGFGLERFRKKFLEKLSANGNVNVIE